MTPAGATLRRKCACGGSHNGHADCAECHRKRPLQRKPTGGAERGGVPAIVHDVLRTPGQPLDAGTRTFMALRFGHDFRDVRVHRDGQAAQSARAVNALGYTVGRHVVFGAGQYAPQTSEGRHLIAHELTHVLQQRSTNSIDGLDSIGSEGGTAEREANLAAHAVANGRRAATVTGHAPPTTLHRLPFGVTVPTGLRPLDPVREEAAILRPVFSGSLTYSSIFLSDAVGGRGREYTVAVPGVGQVINIGPTPFAMPGSNPSLLIHESTHCWQAQHHPNPTAYMANSVASRAAAAVVGGDPYCYVPGKPFRQYGAEQIAQQVQNGEPPIIAHIRSVSAGATDPDDVAGLATPRWETRGAKGVRC